MLWVMLSKVWDTKGLRISSHSGFSPEATGFISPLKSNRLHPVLTVDADDDTHRVSLGITTTPKPTPTSSTFNVQRSALMR